MVPQVRSQIFRSLIWWSLSCWDLEHSLVYGVSLRLVSRLARFLQQDPASSRVACRRLHRSPHCRVPFLSLEKHECEGQWAAWHWRNARESLLCASPAGSRAPQGLDGCIVVQFPSIASVRASEVHQHLRRNIHAFHRITPI